MTKKVLLDAQLGIANNDLTDHTSKIELNDEFEDKETTTFGSGGAKERLGGLEESEISITFKQDYDDNSLDEIMWGLRRQVVTFACRADEDAVSASNPEYYGSLLVKKWVPLNGAVGDVAEADVTFPLSGPLQRRTS